jgi:hypothetical protein
MMKNRLYSVLIGVALAVPLSSYAQSVQPITRAQVRNELAQLEKLGYRPGGDHANYPDQIEAAEAKLAARNAALAANQVSVNGSDGVGGVQNGTSVSGSVTSH